jgi:hypothetical protein
MPNSAERELARVKAQAAAYERIWRPVYDRVMANVRAHLPVSDGERAVIIAAAKAAQNTQVLIQRAEGRVAHFQQSDAGQAARRTFVAAANRAAVQVKSLIKDLGEYDLEVDVLQVMHDAVRGLSDTVQCLLHDDMFADRATSMMRCTDILLRAHQAFSTSLARSTSEAGDWTAPGSDNPLDAPAAAWVEVLQAEGLPVPSYLTDILDMVKTKPTTVDDLKVALQSLVTRLQTGASKLDASGWSLVSSVVADAGRLINIPIVDDVLYSNVNVPSVEEYLTSASEKLVEAQQILKRRHNVQGSIVKTREATIAAMHGLIAFLTGVNQHLKAREDEAAAEKAIEEAAEAIEEVADEDLSEPTYVTSAPPVYEAPVRSQAAAPAIDPEKDRILMELFRKAIQEVVSGAA